MSTGQDSTTDLTNQPEPRTDPRFPITLVGDKPSHCAVLVYLLREARRTNQTARYKSEIARRSGTSHNTINRTKVFQMFEAMGLIREGHSVYQWLPADTNIFTELAHANETLGPRPAGDERHRYPEPIADLLGSNPRQNLLVALLEFPAKEWDISQLCEYTGSSRGTLYEQAELLDEYGIVTYDQNMGRPGSTVTANEESDEYAALYQLNQTLCDSILSEFD